MKAVSHAFASLGAVDVQGGVDHYAASSAGSAGAASAAGSVFRESGLIKCGNCGCARDSKCLSSGFLISTC